MKEKLTHWAQEFRLFVTSKIFLKNFAGMLGVTIGTIILIFLFLRLFTRHNSHITIPSYIGKTIEQANDLKVSRHIEIILIDSVGTFDTTKVAGEIIAQDPYPDALAKKGRNVYVTINPYSRPFFSIPVLWDLPVDMAIRKLKKFNYIITKKPDRAINTVLEVKVNGKVIKRFTKGNAPKLRQGSEIEIVVAEGGGGELQTPTFTCLTYAEALRLIKSNNLSQGSLTVMGNVSDTASAYVYRQYPTTYAAAPINAGDPIDLWLQSDKPYECNDNSDDEEGEFDYN